MCWLEAARTIGLVQARPWGGRLSRGVRRWVFVPATSFRFQEAAICLCCSEDRGPSVWVVRMW
jgi:hypothetical protein